MIENEKKLLSTVSLKGSIYNLVLFRQVEGDGSLRTYQLWLVRGIWDIENPEYIDYQTLNESDMMKNKYPNPKDFVTASISKMTVKFRAHLATIPNTGLPPAAELSWGEQLEAWLLRVQIRILSENEADIIIPG